MSLLVPSGSPSFSIWLHHHVSRGPEWISFLHLIPPPPCLSWFPAGLLHSLHYSTTMSLLVLSGSPSFTSFLHHHVSLGSQRVSVIHLIPPSPCLSWSRVDLLPSLHYSTTMSLLVLSGSQSSTSFLHHHVSLGSQRVSFLHHITPPPCLSWAPAGLIPSPHYSTTMSLLGPSGSPSFTTLLHHHVSLGPQWVSFLHHIAPPPCLSWAPAGLRHSPHCSITMSLLGPSGPHSFTTLLHHHVSLGPQRVSFLHPIAPPQCLSWSPAGLLPSPHCSIIMYLLVPSGSPSFTSLLHNHVSLGPQRVSFLHIITPPPFLSWSRVDLLPPPHCSTIMLLLVPSRSPSFTPIAPPPCLSWSPTGLLPSHHCSSTMSLLIPSGSPSFTPLLHHHVSLGPQGSPSFTSLLHHHVALGPQRVFSFTPLLHHHVSPCPQRVSFVHLIAPPPCPSWSPASLLRSHHCSTTMYLLVPSGSPSFTSLLHHHVLIGPQRVSFVHIIAPPPCLSWSPVGLLPSPHYSTTMSLLVQSGSPSSTSLLHHHVSLGPQRVSFLHPIAPPPCLS